MIVTFDAPLWLYQGKGAWFFVTVPKEISETIKTQSSKTRRGWGSLKVKATIGKNQWETSIFPDRKAETFLLPVKADIRKKEQLSLDETVSITLEIGQNNQKTVLDTYENTSIAIDEESFNEIAKILSKSVFKD